MMNRLFQRIFQFLTRNIAIWGVENGVDLYAGDRWKARVSDPRYWRRGPERSRQLPPI